MSEFIAAQESTREGDWLSEQREAKRRAIAEAEAKTKSEQERLDLEEQNLRVGEERIIALASAASIEPALEQFANEILNNHPDFAHARLARSVQSRACNPPVEMREGEPWSGPLSGGLAALSTGLEDGRHIISAAWNLEFERSKRGDEADESLHIRVVVLPKGIEINGQPVVPATADGFKQQFLHTFDHVTRIVHRRRVRRHHHRPWYKRLARTVLPRRFWNGPFLALAVVILLLALLLGLIAVDMFDVGHLGGWANFRLR